MSLSLTQSQKFKVNENCLSIKPNKINHQEHPFSPTENYSWRNVKILKFHSSMYFLFASCPAGRIGIYNFQSFRLPILDLTDLCWVCILVFHTQITFACLLPICGCETNFSCLNHLSCAVLLFYLHHWAGGWQWKFRWWVVSLSSSLRIESIFPLLPGIVDHRFA